MARSFLLEAEAGFRTTRDTLHSTLQAMPSARLDQRRWSVRSTGFELAKWQKWTDEVGPAGSASNFTNLPNHTPDMYPEALNGQPNF